MKKIICSLFLFSFLIPSLSQASFFTWERITTKNLQGLNKLEEIQGVFKGYGKDHDTDSYLVIYRIDENEAPSGKFNIFLLRKNKKGRDYTGGVFEGEMVSRSRIALLPVGLTNDHRYLKTIDKAVATLEIRTDSKRRRSLLLTSIGDSGHLPEHFRFTKVSDTFELGPRLPYGTYQERKCEYIVQSNTDHSATINIQKSKLDLSGLFQTIFELEGLMVLRKEQLSSSLLNENQDSAIEGILVSLKEGRDRSIVIMKPTTDGKMHAVEMVEEK